LVHHPLLGPAYNQLARACLPQAELAESYIEDGEDEVSAAPTLPTDPSGEESRKRSLFRRGT
ncbi:MAG: hypothetical protein VW239_10580, partial [Candidatus Nanopelagicales bacterium]